jgi:hypothetical protein
MKFTCYTTKDRVSIWQSLTSDLRKDESIDFSFLDVETSKPLVTAELQQESSAIPTPLVKVGVSTRFTQILFVDGPATTVERLKALQKEISALRSADDGIIYILLLDVPFEEVMPTVREGTSQLQSVFAQVRKADGVMFTREATAEVLRCHWLGPICAFYSCQFESEGDKASQIAQSHSLGESIAFTLAVESISQSAQIWTPISSVCSKVATELKFLGIDQKSPAIDKVAANLKLLMPAFEL